MIPRWRCLECRLHQHEFCLRKRQMRRCRCAPCWQRAPAGQVELVPRTQPVWKFAIFGGMDAHGHLVLSSPRVEDIVFRHRVGKPEIGWRGARLIPQHAVVTVVLRDATILRGEFPEIMATLWKVMTGEPL